MPFSLRLALNYLKPRRSFISVVTVISVVGVLLGVAVLIIVLSVMSGFDDMWRTKILGFNAHLTVTGPGRITNVAELTDRVAAVEGIEAAAPYIEGLVFIQHGDQVFTPLLRGIDPAEERAVSQIPDCMLEGTFDFEDEQMIVGQNLAGRLGLRRGSRVLVYSPDNFIAQDEIRLPEELAVSGIFELGMWEYDAGFVLTTLASAREIFGVDSGVQGLHVMTDDPFRAHQCAVRLKAELGPAYNVKSWMQVHRRLFDALRVEKNIMFFLLIFITLVAAFGICNTLITVAVQKTREIGLLKAVGFSTPTIMGVFVWQGAIQGLLGTTLGIGAGLLILRYRNAILEWLSSRLRFELFPKELYRLNEIPAHTSVSDVTVIAVSVLAICTLAGLIPAWRAARLDPVRALRHQ